MYNLSMKKHIITIIAISFLIVFHELGHFLVALMLGIKPQTFAIGFGSTLISKILYGVEFKINMIPLGGYVRLPLDSLVDNPIKWLVVSLAGPLFNFILAFIYLFFALKKLSKYIKINVNENEYNIAIEPNNFCIQNDNIMMTKSTMLNMFENNTIKAKVVGLFLMNKLPKDIKILLTKATIKESIKSNKAFLGPIAVYKLISESVMQNPLRFLLLQAQISVSLGMFNLIPFPLMDGSKTTQTLLMMIGFNFENAFIGANIIGLVLILLIWIKYGKRK